MRKSIILLLFIILFSFSMFSCVQSVGDENAKDLTSEPSDLDNISGNNDLGIISGKVSNASEIWPNRIINIYVADYYGKTEDEGLYLLEPSLFPKSEVKPDGSFTVRLIKPGEHILIVGPNPQEGIVIKTGGKPLIINIKQKETLDIGTIQVFP